jgi:hypothetical protein
MDRGDMGTEAHLLASESSQSSYAHLLTKSKEKFWKY